MVRKDLKIIYAMGGLEHLENRCPASPTNCGYEAFTDTDLFEQLLKTSNE